MERDILETRSVLLFQGKSQYCELIGATSTQLHIWILTSSAARAGSSAAISLFTGRGMLWSGVRQLLLGFAAAGVTYAIGHAIGAASL